MFLSFGLSAILAVVSPIAAAQSEEASEPPAPRAIVTDRPTDSASPLLVPRRAFQLEAGYKLSQSSDGASSLDVRVFPDLLARYGINEKVEVRLATAGFTFESGTEGEERGQSDVSVGAKIFLADESGKRPQMGLLVDVSLPVGHSDITSGYVVPEVLFLGSNSLTDSLALTYNVGPSLVTKKKDGVLERNVDLNYAVALSGSVGGPVSLFGEFFGSFAFGQNLPTSHTFQAGTTILLSRRFQIDVRGGLGLNEGAADWLVGAGLAFRLPR